LVQQQQLQQAHGSSFGAEQHYYEDEGSPPNINTAILDVEEDEGAQRQPLKDVSAGLPRALLCRRPTWVHP
jgi:hypothetical protein